VSLVLADTSVWIGHFRRGNPKLRSLLAMDQVLSHPLIVIELACGTPPAPRERTLADLRRLRQASVATVDEVLSLIGSRRLHNSGCGAVDMALLASVLLTADSLLWTVDKNLGALATRLGVAFRASGRAG
jgi:predicted nucleic acid-binding protein